jgi:hypothetical protein
MPQPTIESDSGPVPATSYSVAGIVLTLTGFPSSLGASMCLYPVLLLQMVICPVRFGGRGGSVGWGRKVFGWLHVWGLNPEWLSRLV